MSDSTPIASEIAQTPIVAIPAHLEAHGKPAMPAELEGHSCIIYALQGARVWGFHGRFAPVTHQPKGAFRTNDAEQIRTAILAGLGIAVSPTRPAGSSASKIASAVRPVLVDYEPARLSISAVQPEGRLLASKVRVAMLTVVFG